MISVGYDIEEILKNPSDPKWADTSIEFCGGTHVYQTGDIIRFTVLEESSISKGIRRIIAVTGEEAYLFHRVADELQKKISFMEKFSGSELGLAIKNLAKVCFILFIFVGTRLHCYALGSKT